MNTPKPRSSSAWVKHGVLFEPAESWEGRHMTVFTNRIEQMESGQIRFWYQVHHYLPNGQVHFAIAVAEGEIGGDWRRYEAAVTSGEPDTRSRYAIGGVPDGAQATQAVCVRLPDGRYRLYFWVHGGGMGRYLAAESDNGRHFRVIDPHRAVLYHLGDRATQFPYSHAGLTAEHSWNKTPRPEHEPAAPPHRVTNDATSVYQLPDGTFELYTAALVSADRNDPRYMPHDNAPGLIRVIDRLTSDDGLNFDQRTRVIERDENDPIDQQFYHMPVVHTEHGRIGLLGHYRCQAQTMDLEWCFSDDGVNWRRDWRTGWLPRSEPGQAIDSYGIYPPGNLIRHDNRWWLFYTGSNTAHNSKDAHGEMRKCIMLASIDRLFE